MQQELVRRGVPASVIAVVGEGESDPLVPTADGVREPRNRRVEIEVPRAAAAPAPAPVAIVPGAGPSPGPLWAASLGGLYGNNFRETDDGTTSALAGVEGRVEYLLTPILPISFEQALLYGFQSEDDGLAGRSTAGIDLQGNFANLHPYVGANFGADYGKAIQDGLVGPRDGVKFDLAEQRTPSCMARQRTTTSSATVAWTTGFSLAGLVPAGASLKQPAVRRLCSAARARVPLSRVARGAARRSAATGGLQVDQLTRGPV